MVICVVVVGQLCLLNVLGQFHRLLLFVSLTKIEKSSVVDSFSVEVANSTSTTTVTEAVKTKEKEEKTYRRRISAKLVHPLKLQGLNGAGQDVHYRCEQDVRHHHFMYREWGGPRGVRRPLFPPFDSTEYGFIDTHVQIQHLDLKILIVGNSLGEQLRAGLDEAMCYYYGDNNNDDDKNKSNSSLSSTLYATERNHENVTEVLRGLPVDREAMRNETVCEVSIYGKDDVFEDTCVVWPPPPSSSPKHTENGNSERRGFIASVKFQQSDMINTTTIWNHDNPAIQELVNRLSSDKQTMNSTSPFIRSSKSNASPRAMKEEAESSVVDVFIYQWQSGHVRLWQFDESRLDDTVVAASTLFRSDIMILTTIFPHNNARFDVDIRRMNDINARIRSYARRYNEKNTTMTLHPPGADSGNSRSSKTATTVRAIMVLDYAMLIEQYMEKNAQHIGMFANETYTLRLKKARWKHLISLACTSLPYPNDPKGCSPGMVSVDGIHLCPETIHGRVNAAMVCMLDCAYHQIRSSEEIQRCSEECNRKYMTVNPLPFPFLPAAVATAAAAGPVRGGRREIILTRRNMTDR